MIIDPGLLLAFAAASFILLVIPGPTIIMVISQALAHSSRTAFASLMGVGLGRSGCSHTVDHRRWHRTGGLCYRLYGH